MAKSTPPVGLEPTTARLRAARSTDWARKATDIIHITSLFYQYYHQSTWIHDHMDIPIYHHRYMPTCLYDYMTIHSLIHTYILTMTPLTHMLHACLSCFYTSYLLLFISVLLPLTSFYLHILYHHILTAAFSLFSCLPLIPFSIHSLGSFRGSVGRAIGC